MTHVQENEVVHGYIQTAIGLVVDEDWANLATVLGRALDVAKDLEAEVLRLRGAIAEAVALCDHPAADVRAVLLEAYKQ